MESAPQPVAIGNDEGEARWWFGALAVFKATAADTGGQMTIVEVTEHPGAEAPLHVHYRDDEGFCVLEGDVSFEVGGTTIEATAGDYVFGPRNIPHRFKVGDGGCRMLFILTPGGIEHVIRATSERRRAAASRRCPRRSRRPRNWRDSRRSTRNTATNCLLESTSCSGHGSRVPTCRRTSTTSRARLKPVQL